jgi:oligopeptide transport system ATP-binding protein
MQIRDIIAEPLRLHGLINGRGIDAQVAELLGRVGLEPYMMDRYPHEMSGGQRQRIAIARALSLRPSFIVADEPVSALDVSVRAGILNILLDLQREEGISVLFISHDLSIVDRVADRIAVMYQGRIVEEGSTARLMDSPRHPYTRALLSAIPEPDPVAKRLRIRLRAEESETPVGERCAFAGRCPEATERCRREAPVLRALNDDVRVSCHYR